MRNRFCGRRRANEAQVIADYLIQEKVPQVFGVCGHGNIRFADALYERSHDTRTISVHQQPSRQIRREGGGDLARP